MAALSLVLSLPHSFAVDRSTRGIGRATDIRRGDADGTGGDFRAAFYDMPRSTLYRFIGVPAHAYQVDLARLPLLWRFF